jgi:CBS domain containing-hemolysin-like protein
LLAVVGASPCFAASEFIDKAASVLALFIIFVMPIGLIALFWLVHVLPEKIAHKRHHPQKDAIHVLCLLSLVFGGLLWPLAWLWAFTKPVFHQMAYGRDRSDDYYEDNSAVAESAGARAGPAESSAAALRAEIAALSAKLADIESRAGAAGSPTNTGGAG